jgi:hypothetical protein
MTESASRLIDPIHLEIPSAPTHQSRKCSKGFVRAWKYDVIYASHFISSHVTKCLVTKYTLRPIQLICTATRLVWYFLVLGNRIVQIMAILPNAIDVNCIKLASSLHCCICHSIHTQTYFRLSLNAHCVPLVAPAITAGVKPGILADAKDFGSVRKTVTN